MWHGPAIIPNAPPALASQSLSRADGRTGPPKPERIASRVQGSLPGVSLGTKTAFRRWPVGARAQPQPFLMGSSAPCGLPGQCPLRLPFPVTAQNVHTGRSALGGTPGWSPGHVRQAEPRELRVGDPRRPIPSSHSRVLVLQARGSGAGLCLGLREGFRSKLRPSWFRSLPGFYFLVRREVLPPFPPAPTVFDL